MVDIGEEKHQEKKPLMYPLPLSVLEYDGHLC